MVPLCHTFDQSNKTSFNPNLSLPPPLCRSLPLPLVQSLLCSLTRRCIAPLCHMAPQRCTFDQFFNKPQPTLPLGDPLPLPLVQSLSCSLTGCQPTLKFNVVPNATLYISGYIFAQPDPTPSSARQLRYVPTLSSHMVPRTNALNWLSELVFSLLPLSFLGNYSFPTYLSDLLYLVLSTPYHYPAQCDDALYKLPHPF